jgi:hypothetical protein
MIGLALRSLSMRWKVLMPALLTLSSMVAQHPILDAFIGRQSGDDVFLQWTISRGSLCDGIRIERSIGEDPFEEVGNIVGVCGSLTEAVDYDFLDTRPASGKRNRYRLELGNNGFSDPIEVFYFDFEGESFAQIIPLGSGDLRLIRNGAPVLSDRLRIYDMRGQQMYEEALGAEQEHVLDLASWPEGQYLTVVLRDGGILFSARFMMLQ